MRWIDAPSAKKSNQNNRNRASVCRLKLQLASPGFVRALTVCSFHNELTTTNVVPFH
jgi:hypothetical protein